MKIKTLILLLVIFGFSSGQTSLYVHNDAEQYVRDTKTIAILPFKATVKLRDKHRKDLTIEDISRIEKDLGFDVQRSMNSWFFKRKKRNALLVNIQNPKVTNALLKEKGFDLFEANDLTAKKLGELLGVDAIISGSIVTNRPMSNGAAIGLALLGASGSTNSAVANIDITHCEDNEVVVNYNKKVRGSIGSDTSGLVNTLMRKLSRRIPYTK